MSGFQLSKKAEQDLKEIYQYGYRQHGERQADRYIYKLEKAFYFLAENPLICPERVEFVPPVRIHHHDKHLLVYIYENNIILIIRLLHERMDIKSRLDDSLQ
jgi:toxin ParE1/3/4